MPGDTGNGWLSGPEATRFAFELSKIRIGVERGTGSNETPFDTVNARVLPLLDLIETFAPVHFATLWKYKTRGGVISALARSKGYDPDPRELPYEFVCPIAGTHAEIIERDAVPLDDCEYEWLRVWDCKDIDELPEDPYWNTKDVIRSAGLKRQVAFVMGGFCADSREGTDYILNLYIDDEKRRAGQDVPDFTTGDARFFIKSVANRLASGICALVEYRKNRITEQMIANRDWSGTTLGNTLGHAVEGIVPAYIHATDAYLLLRGNTDEMQIAWKRPGSRNLPPNAIDALVDWLGEQVANPPAPEVRSSHKDIIRVGSEDIAALGQTALTNGFDGILAARLVDRSHAGQPAGFILVGNRKSDYALSRDPGYEIEDQFDWEDEQYLHHAASVLDFIIGMFGAEEQKLRQAEVLGHEMLAPARFIWETAERLMEDADGSYPYKFDRMKLREIQDIMDSSEFVNLIAQSISSVGDTSNNPPASRYRPEETDLATVAREMARVVLPLCKKFGVDNKRIVIAKTLPELHMDGGAVGRIFMNLIANAVKYSNHNEPDRFRVVIDSELLSLNDLGSSYDGILLDSYVRRAKALGIREGYLVTAKDHGIGIINNNPQRIFEAGHREIGHIAFGAMGAGLGLHVVRRIMEDHFGRAWVSRRSTPTEISLFFPDLLFTSAYTKLDSWKRKAT